MPATFNIPLSPTAADQRSARSQDDRDLLAKVLQADLLENDRILLEVAPIVPAPVNYGRYPEPIFADMTIIPLSAESMALAPIPQYY